MVEMTNFSWNYRIFVTACFQRLEWFLVLALRHCVANFSLFLSFPFLCYKFYTSIAGRSNVNLSRQTVDETSRVSPCQTWQDCLVFDVCKQMPGYWEKSARKRLARNVLKLLLPDDDSREKYHCACVALSWKWRIFVCWMLCIVDYLFIYLFYEPSLILLFLCAP